MATPQSRPSGASPGGSRHTSKVIRDLEALKQDLLNSQAGDSLPWIKTAGADSFFGVVILVNGLFIGLDMELVDGFHWGTWAVESAFLLLFLLEITLRLLAERPAYRRFFDAWGVADVVLTAMGCVDTWVLTPIVASSGDARHPLSSVTVFRMLRLLRLVRLVRMVRKFGDLLKLIRTIRNSIKAVAWMSVLLGMLIYAGSVLTLLLLGVPHRDTNADVDLYFGSLGSAIFSHFLAVTCETWPDVALAAMSESRWWAPYFAVVIAFGNCALVNVMVGTIVEQVLRVSQENELRRASWSKAIEVLRRTMVALFHQADLDDSGDLGREELRLLLRDPRAREIMLAFGMNMHIPPKMLHTIVDLNGDGACSFPEFFDACVRLSGSTECLQSAFVQHDVCACRDVLLQTLGKLEAELEAAFAAPVAPEQAPGSPDPPAAGERLAAEAEVQALRERLDRFGRKQQRIQAELQAWREEQVQGCDSQGAGSLRRPSGNAAVAVADFQAPPLPLGARGKRAPSSPLAAAVMAARVPALLLQGAGRELGERVMDSVFGGPPERPAVLEPRRRLGSLHAAKRRQLEAEFAEKKAAEARGLS